MNSKKWCIFFLIESSILVLIIISFVVVVDPFFHYHKPFSFLQYPINNERYQNDGIVKHFDYNAIITGTSMTENFKASEVNELFHVTSVKVPFSGGTYKEINQALERAIDSNKNLKYIIRGIDLSKLMLDKDAMSYELSNYPLYLYDNNIFNDVKYVFNKKILEASYNVINYTIQGNLTTNFDDYANWNSGYNFGKNVLDGLYKRVEKVKEQNKITKDELICIEENVNQNLIQIIKDNPDVQFYYFYPPYSIYYWDDLNNTGNLEKYLNAERFASKILLEYDNIHLFSFWNKMDIITNLDNYKDTIHYGEKVNSQILYWMITDEDLLTKDNYNDYYDKILKTLKEFNYDKYFS